jgi:hypothetical protein
VTAGVLELAVAYRDVRAADLRLHLGLVPQEPLAARTVTTRGWSVELRILGGSHQVVVEGMGGPAASETVACHLGEGMLPGALPSRHLADVDGVGYRFRSRTTRFDPVAFDRWVVRATTALASGPRSLCAAFPGDRHGITGVEVRSASADTLAWRSVHTYPQTGEVVVTSTRLTRPPAAEDLR